MIKKSYIKPSMSFFALDVNESGSSACEIQQTFPEHECPVEIEAGFTIINRGSCKYHGSEYDDFICYHVPMPDMNIFGS